jgi:hypothetical protein
MIQTNGAFTLTLILTPISMLNLHQCPTTLV